MRDPYNFTKWQKSKAIHPGVLPIFWTSIYYTHTNAYLYILYMYISHHALFLHIPDWTGSMYNELGNGRGERLVYV
ncbi:hypothetical protein GDO81_001004 [Engystomops pustulosus]|uniref:Uncharacterized protein n=1 Tax=Engystomops pustulosus TaxID=76066 RepID=A0AAV7DAL9_ENGPU|nr:hypothetical protein GDO81_001004 [Engystomops pustulosus]